jgi:glycosyltransferase involved in cell wall biosynthesis
VLLNEVVEPLWREALHPDIAIYPHNVLPSFFPTHRSLRVLVLHDVLFLHGDNWKSAGNRYRTLKLKQSLQRADVIVTVSLASRAEILKLLPEETKVLVIPNALAEGFEELVPAKDGNKPGRARVFHFGGHVPSKNTKRVFEAIAMLQHEGYDVDLAVAAMSGRAELAEHWRKETRLAKDAFQLLPALSDAELRQAYAQADIHCMPSTGEGFGIPVIEAARCGTPNVLSPLPVFRELIGDDAIYTGSLQAKSIAQGIRECLKSDTRAMVQRAQKRAEEFLFESVDSRHATPALQVIAQMAASRR